MDGAVLTELAWGGVKSLPRHTECAYYFLEVLAMMRFRHLWMLLPAAALLLATVSCGRGDKSGEEKAPVLEDEEKSAPASNDKKQKLSVEERMAALDALGRHFNSLPGKDFKADNQAMLTWLQGRPEYEASGISKSGSVWARFTDGRVVGLLRSRDEKGRPVLGSGGGGQRSPDQRPVAYAPDDKKSMFMMPSSHQVRLLVHHSMIDNENWRAHLLPPQTAKWLEAAGYSVVHGDCTVDGLKKTSGDGIFHFKTHGGIVDDDNVNVCSNTRVDDEHELLYANDLDEHRLCYAELMDYGWHYGINPSFVTRYMSFADNAVVFLDSCDGAKNDTMRNACFEKGASVYVGWTKEIDWDSGYRASTFLFDRLLAGNQYVRESPNQRPFDFGAVHRDMMRRNYDTDLGNLSSAEAPPLGHAGAGSHEPSPASLEKRGDDTSLLAIHHKSGHTFAGLRPSVANLVVFETLEELHLLGYFGAKQGSVTINGHAVTVKSWEPGTVKVELPSSGPGSAGPVVVEVDGRHSNTVPLTEWRGQFRYTQEDNSHGPALKKTATFTLHLRHDVHAYRLVPHVEPHANSAKNRGFTSLMAAKDSKVEWAFSGAATAFKTTYELSGSGAFTKAEVKKGGPVFSFSGELDAELKKVSRTSLSVEGPYGTETVTDVAGKATYEGQSLGILPDIDTLKLDGQFAIQAGKVVRDQGKIHSQLEWDDIPAKHLPGADTLAAAPQSNWQFAEAVLVTQLGGLPVGPPRRLAERGQGR